MSYNWILAFIFGLSTAGRIQLGGELVGSDIFALILIPFLALGRERRRALYDARYVLGGIIVWFFGAFITDLVKGTPPEDLIRGWSKIVFFFLSMVAIQLITKNKIEYLIAAALGGVCAGIVTTIFIPNEYIGSNPFEQSSWKFGFGPSLTMLAAIAGSFKPFLRCWGAIGSAGPLTLMAVVNLAMNSRTIFGIAAVAALFCVFKRAIDARPLLKQKLSPTVFAIMLAFGLGVSQILIEIYSIAAGGGLLGLEAKDKYEAQTAGDLGLMQSGRTESLVSLQAIIDSPIIGHGSWARDIYYVALLAQKLEAAGVNLHGDAYATDLIPTHSYLFGAWVEAGFAGGLFWSGVLIFATFALYRLLIMESAYVSFIVYSLMVLIWDVLFSPFGREQRFFGAVKICIALWVVSSLSRTSKKTSNTK